MKILPIFFLILPLHAIMPREDLKEPSWVHLKRSENLKNKGEYSLAIIEARKAKMAYIDEKIYKFYAETRYENRDKTEYEIKKIVESKKSQLMLEDAFPQYHELMGDLYFLTGMLQDAEKEYKSALSGKIFFEYKQKEIEIKYKLADVYSKKKDYDIADIVYREITEDFFNTKDKEFWNRIKINIKNDPSLSHVFRIYRIDGIEYAKALFKIGKRSAIIQKKDDAIFFLTLSSIVWMTYYSELIKKYEFDFTYASPTDFINFLTGKGKYEYSSDDCIIGEIMFYIGYVYHLDNNVKIKDFFFNISKTFARGTKIENEIVSLIDFLNVKLKEDIYVLSYEEVIN